MCINTQLKYRYYILDYNIMLEVTAVGRAATRVTTLPRMQYYFFTDVERTLVVRMCDAGKVLNIN